MIISQRNIVYMVVEFTMRLQISKSKNDSSLYFTKSIYVNGVRTSKVVEKLGTYDKLEKNSTVNTQSNRLSSIFQSLEKGKRRNKRSYSKIFSSKQLEKGNKNVFCKHKFPQFTNHLILV